MIRAGCGAGAALLLLYPALMFCGAAINLANDRVEPAEGAMIWAAQHLMPTVAGVVVLAGIVAAGLSSATTFLSLVAFSASHDVAKPGTASDAAKLWISRWTMLAVGLAALALAMFVPPNIFWITYFAGTVFASSWGPVAFMSVWSRRITEAGAFWGIVAGFAGNVVPKALALLGVDRVAGLGGPDHPRRADRRRRSPYGFPAAGRCPKRSGGTAKGCMKCRRKSWMRRKSGAPSAGLRCW